MRSFILFKEKNRHIIRVYDRETLLTTLLDVVKADVVNAIHCELQILAFIQHKLIGAFPSTTLKHCKSLVTDIPDQKEQKKIVSLKHNRSHRAAQENVKSILRDYFFPKMLRLATEVTLKCKVCSTAKYTRHPTRLTVGQKIWERPSILQHWTLNRVSTRLSITVRTQERTQHFPKGNRRCPTGTNIKDMLCVCQSWYHPI